MKLFNIVGDIIGAGVKVALAPIAIASDVIAVATGNEPTAAKDLIKSAGDNLTDAVNELEK
jgi:hypothetical protein